MPALPKPKLLFSAILSTLLGACIGATYRGAGEIDTDPEIPQMHTTIFGSLAGLIVWATAIKLFTRASQDFGKIRGAMLTGAVCGPLFFLVVQAFYWNGIRLILGIGGGVILGAVVGLLLSLFGFLLKDEKSDPSAQS